MIQHYPLLKELESKYGGRKEIIETEKKKLFKKIGIDLEQAEQDLIAYTEGRKQKDFFLWDVYFAEVFVEKTGFDIVIGNPPYIGERKNKHKFITIQSSSSNKYYLGRMDYFYFFFHLSLDFMAQKSTCSFISTNYFPTALGARNIKNNFKIWATIFEIINFNEAKVFDSAAGQHNMITFFFKGKHNTSSKIISTNKKGLLKPIDFADIITGNDDETNIQVLNENDLWDGEENYIRLGGVNKLSSPLNAILDKIVKKSTNLLGNICSPLIGLESSLDDVYVLSWSDVNRIIGNRKNELELIKPFFKNSDIDRYYVKKEADKYIIYLHEKIKNVKEYKHIWTYLLENSKAIKSRKRS